MSDAAISNSAIVSAYLEKTPGSARLAEKARDLLPSGIAHDTRYLEPYGIYVEHAQGPRKWDVDGNEYVDYFGGHGALLLGHNHPVVLRAIHAAMEQGSHFGSNHPREVRWAELVHEMVPSAERVRFTSSGTEATHMALRLARAYTGRHKLARIMTHFHGWHDHMTSGYSSHFDGSATPGVLEGVAENVVLLPPNDIDAARRILGQAEDIAALFLEPTGGSFGMVPISADYIAALRDLTAQRGIVLVFDEVITGFRVSPGGAQARFAITPDMTTLAKIVAGGLPGGAVVGAKAILDGLDFQAAEAKGKEKIAHPGTFNANPVSAAAGIAALEIIKDSDACERANAYTDELRARLNQVLADERVAWSAYGTFSGFHTFTNSKGRKLDPRNFNPYDVPFEELKTRDKRLVHRFRLAMLVNGVDLMGWPGGMVSATHGPKEMDATVEAFAASLAMLRRDGEL
jgi:glutamate-1-semialdehyde 2,1-aminomutase